MNIFIPIFWALVGWCGTRLPRPPRPDPVPGPLKSLIYGIIGGIGGGVAFFYAFSLKVDLTTPEFAATCIGAFVGGFVVTEIASLFEPKKN